MNEPVFTPLDETLNVRGRFLKSDVEFLPGYMDVRMRGKKGEVIIKGKRYEVIGIPCDLPNCVCDAFIREVELEVAI